VRANSVQISYLSVLLLPAIVAWQKGSMLWVFFEPQALISDPKTKKLLPTFWGHREENGVKRM